MKNKVETLLTNPKYQTDHENVIDKDASLVERNRVLWAGYYTT